MEAPHLRPYPPFDPAETKRRRAMTPGESLGEVLQLIGDEHLRRWATVREAYPNASEDEVYLRFAASQFDRVLMINAYGWDTELPEGSQAPYSLRHAISQRLWARP